MGFEQNKIRRNGIWKTAGTTRVKICIQIIAKMLN